MIEKKYSFLNLELDFFLRRLLLFSVFIISIVLGNFYSNGDQIFYNIVYEGVSGKNFTDAYLLYFFHIQSVELVHFFLIWAVSSLGINKIFFMAICNTLLANLVIIFFDRLKVNFLVTSIFILTNFYFYVLLFAAERLKFGFIFFLIAILYQENFFYKIFFLILSALSHLQMIIVSALIALELVLKELKHFLIHLEFKWILLFAVPFLASGFLVLESSIARKIIGYGSSYGGLSEFLRLSIFLIMALYYSERKMQTLTHFIPLFIVVFFVGDGRINMIAYIFFLYSALQYRNGLNLGVLVTTLYFFYLNIDFVKRIILYGSGFSL